MILEQTSLHFQSIAYMISLTNWVFGDEKYVTVSDNKVSPFETNLSSIQEFKIGNFRAPVFRLETITPKHWAWNAIYHKTVPLEDAYMRTILQNVRGTYAAIIIHKGDYLGYHLLSISKSRTTT